MIYLQKNSNKSTWLSNPDQNKNMCSSGTWCQILTVDLYIETVNNVEIEEKWMERF